MKSIKIILTTLLGLMLNTSALVAQDDGDCLMCHEDTELTTVKNGKNVSMFVDIKIMNNSAHKKTKCINCHSDLKGVEFPHSKRVKVVDCNKCHEGFSELIKSDIHNQLNLNLGNKKLTCKICHNTHDVKATNRIKNKSREFCGKCHKNNVLAGEYHSKGKSNETCKECHNDTNYDNLLGMSVHKNLSCSNCHGFVAANLKLHEDGDKRNKSADCFACHSEIAAEHHESIHGISLENGISDAAKCQSCHGSHQIYKAGSDSSLVYPGNIVKTCGKCHDDDDFAIKHNSSIKTPGKMYSVSVHGKLVSEGDSLAPSCSDCHGIHNIKNRVQENSTIDSKNISKTCSKCHKEIAEEYMESVHWYAVKKGIHMSPTCNDCHSEHSIHAVNTIDKRHEMKVLQEQTCLVCHRSLIMSGRYGVEASSAVNYQDSYHGLAVMRGDEDAAMCVDCHGVHKILPKYHEESTIGDSLIVQTCQKCHSGATETFSRSYSHVNQDETAKFIEDIVELIYFWLIVIVIGGMFIHNFIIFIHDLRRRRREINKKIRIPRFTTNELIQHYVLLTSFIILAVTGFQLKYPESWWSEGLTTLGLDEVARQWTHRISAVVMIGLSVWHVVYLIITARGRDVIKSIFPRFSDLKTAWQNILYNLNLRKKHPEFDNYNYIEKAEYWALIWGTIVMGVTGAILWFPTIVGNWAPSWVIKVSEIVHFYEAILASLAIVVWHWFFVIFRPVEYPLNFTCVDGKMTIRHFKEEHKLKFKKIIIEWLEFKSGKKTKKQLNHFTKLFMNSVEKHGVNVDEFINSQIEKDDELKTYLKKQGLI